MACNKCIQYRLNKSDTDDWCVHRPYDQYQVLGYIGMFERDIISAVIDVCVKAGLPIDIRRLLLYRILIECDIYSTTWWSEEQISAYDRWIKLAGPDFCSNIT